MDRIVQLQRDVQYAECAGRVNGWRSTGVAAHSGIIAWLEEDLERALLYETRLINDHEGVLRELHEQFAQSQTNIYVFNDIMMKAFFFYRSPLNIARERLALANAKEQLEQAYKRDLEALRKREVELEEWATGAGTYG